MEGVPHDIERLIEDTHRCRDLCVQFIRGSEFSYENNEFVSLEPRNQFIIGEGIPEALADLDKQHVPYGMTEGIIYHFEIVDIQVQQRTPVTYSGFRKHLLHFVDELRPVGKPRELILERQLPYLLLVGRKLIIYDRQFLEAVLEYVLLHDPVGYVNADYLDDIGVFFLSYGTAVDMDDLAVPPAEGKIEAGAAVTLPCRTYRVFEHMPVGVGNEVENVAHLLLAVLVKVQQKVFGIPVRRQDRAVGPDSHGNKVRKILDPVGIYLLSLQVFLEHR